MDPENAANVQDAPDQPAPQTPASTPAPAPTGAADFAVPDGFELVEKGTGDRAKRWQEQAAGSQKLFEAARELGVNDADGLRELGSKMKALQDSGLSIDALTAAIAKPEAPADGATPQFDMDALMAQVDDRIGASTAKAQFDSDSSQTTALVAEYAAKLAPEGSSDETKAFITAGFREKLAEAQKASLYPESHPLHETHLKPLGRDAIEEVFTKTKSGVAALLGGRANQIAKSAPVSTPAGSRGVDGDDDTKNMTPAQKSKAKRRERIDKAVKAGMGAGDVTSAA